ncbi:OsmC family protein [Rhodovibrionaceae bacterium A322]
MKARVKWIEDMKFLGESASGHGIVIDGADDKVAPSPMELLLLGVGGCSSIDVVMILQKMRENVEDVVADVTSERAETDPKVFTKINLHFKVTGTGLSESKVAQAVKLSADKYCSASIMLGKAAEITHSFEVIEP